MTKLTFAASAAALFLVFGSPVRAATPATPTTVSAQDEEPRAPPYTLAFDVATIWRQDAGYRLFSDSDRDAAAGLSLARDLVRVGSRGVISAAAGWQAESLDNVWNGNNEASLDVHTFYGAGRLRWPVHRWVEPQIEIAGGAARGEAKLSLSPNGSFAGEDWSFLARAGAGIRFRTGTTNLRTLPLRGLALSLLVEGGYQVGTPLVLDVRAPAPSDEKVAKDLIPSDPTKLGDLGRSYPYLRWSFALHF